MKHAMIRKIFKVVKTLHELQRISQQQGEEAPDASGDPGARCWPAGMGRHEETARPPKGGCPKKNQILYF